MSNETNKESAFLSHNSRGTHRIAYSDRGPKAGRIIICVHVLTGNAHDFDVLTPGLVQLGYRVIAVDMPGRGRSDFLENPEDYCFRQYLQDLTALLVHLEVTEPASIDWIGSSMGGLLGIILAGIPNTVIRNMVINDVGPSVPDDALDFIAGYISQIKRFKTVKDVENNMRETRGLTWGPITDEQWQKMAENNVRTLPDGALTYHYDTKIAESFGEKKKSETDLWPFWDKITGPVLVLRGEDSAILPQGIADEMQKRGPGQTKRMTLKIIEACGHAPSLMAPDQIEIITDWLSSQAQAQEPAPA